ncbi:MAG: hypothetical protein Q8934_05660 [Bacillota bacterium]|nr:hypothetical protein [Bacillota bacterium]
MIKGQKYVWYASYGSNINSHRFLCYIQGGKPEGSSKVETGCKDPSLPLDETNYIIDHPLYFAKDAGRWDFQGVAFIGLDKDETSNTLSKMYLITVEQFLDVVKQENNGIEFEIDLNEVKIHGSKIFREHAWYGNMLYLGEKNEYPIFTFTSPWGIDEIKWKKPSNPYLKTIITGLQETYTNKEIYEYFKDKPGIKGEYSDEELAKLISL